MDCKDERYEELKLNMFSTSMGMARNSQYEVYSDPFVDVCQKILKTEWEKLKKDLAAAVKDFGRK